jgi:F0F1-type ATP synthase assembly protein I
MDRVSLAAGLGFLDLSGAKRDGGGGDWTRALREAAPYLGIGATFAIAVGLGVAGGHWLDGKLGTEPLFLLLGGSAGLIVAFVEFFKTVNHKRR